MGQSSAKGGSATSCESVEMTSKKKRRAVEKRERRQVWLTTFFGPEEIVSEQLPFNQPTLDASVTIETESVKSSGF